MAGTYSPMLSLVIAHFHLLANPDIMTKLRTELAANPLAVTPTQLEQLPYISGITHTNGKNETKTYTIPPGTSISVSTLLIHTNESIFPDPWKFEPERWTNADEATLARRRRCMLSFMRGSRACVGMHLANAEMVVAVAAIARWNMRLFETTDQDVAFCHDYHVLCPRLGSKGLRVKDLGRQ
ncbi:putative Trichodiene oxygenase [Mollisia scopiformis]|uniref:Putative Trichodiene oxygenase n=1 Tax=Mollisia scopiformis TaxID=149040 RepID=A0A194WTG9_MOLSC|nr:putative Trichodiene oxygenase [Mollisia scopiformis]KUJ11258.1 putative Trichodiene oxygenase [Mollisia scopiformis]